MQTSHQHSLCHLHTSTLQGTLAFSCFTHQHLLLVHALEHSHTLSVHRVYASQSLHTHPNGHSCAHFQTSQQPRPPYRAPPPALLLLHPGHWSGFAQRANCLQTVRLPWIHSCIFHKFYWGHPGMLPYHSTALGLPQGILLSPIFPPFSPYQSSEAENELWAGQLCQGPALVHLTPLAPATAMPPPNLPDCPSPAPSPRKPHPLLSY